MDDGTADSEDLRDAPQEVVKYYEYLASKSRSSSLGIAGYYVSGGSSPFDVAVMEPVVDLARDIEADESLLDHLGKVLETGEEDEAVGRAIDHLFGKIAS